MVLWGGRRGGGACSGGGAMMGQVGYGGGGGGAARQLIPLAHGLSASSASVMGAASGASHSQSSTMKVLSCKR